MTAAIRLIIIDDHTVVRAGIRSLLAKESQIKVVGEGATGREALELCRSLNPDVILLDIRLPDISGFQVCRRLKETSQPPAVVFLTSFEDDQTLIEALAAGADGYLLKDVEGQDIAEAIRGAARGFVFMAPAFSRAAATAACKPKEAGDSPKALIARLSVQERRAIELASTGLTNKGIADAMHLGDGTARNYLSAAFAKLEVESRAEAVAIWIRASMS